MAAQGDAQCFGLFACFPCNGAESTDDPGLDEKTILSKFKKELYAGIRVQKFSKDLPPAIITMKCDADAKNLLFDDAPGDPECQPTSMKNLKIRRATDPDPDVKHFAGSKVLRDNLDPSQAMKAFILDKAQPKSNINLTVDDETQCDRIVQGFKLLFKEAMASAQ
jgi:hypothetical protein